MMRVTLAPEPDTFDERVRQPGLRALDRLARRYSVPKSEIPSSKHPDYWRRSLDDLLAAYNRICSYLCLYIPRGTGARSVDHMVPEVCGMGSSLRVGQLPARMLVDEFAKTRRGHCSGFVRSRGRLVRTGVGCISGVACRWAWPNRPPRLLRKPSSALRLNDGECCGAREEYAEEYWSECIPFDYMRRRAPFVANELRRQNKLREADA